ncbi:hypothetical protein [Alteromonas halophila]|uniref:Uncharacterized protein n=1 Tax=Alteromonas halophila TaxID=516698 RepID=A0A918JR78_9ALTE|nr:hypothetical protein [Alteromonas halophila]GGW95216.1 hypothetical protein GCM10007391_31850 [Alteromonas halophila]
MLTSLFLTALLISTASDLQCDKDARHLTASYSVTTSQANSSPRTSQLVLWRNGERVAHQYPQTQVTEAWTHVKHQWLKPMRYFDAHQRAIEYQPGERIHGKVDSDWSYRYQLVSNALLSRMHLRDTTGTGCQTVQSFELEENGRTLTLSWLPALHLVKSFTASTANTRSHWSLETLHHNADNTAAFFTKRAQYKSTDFADIGDDHTDPFLTNMVNQGFIEAGASGFYDSHGQAMSGSHSH